MRSAANPTVKHHVETDTITISGPRVRVPCVGLRTFMTVIVDSDGTMTVCDVVDCAPMDVTGDVFYQRIVKPSMYRLQSALARQTERA